VLVGGYSRLDTYFRKLAALVKAEGLEKQVRFMGKVPDAQLYGWYRAADVFVPIRARSSLTQTCATLARAASSGISTSGVTAWAGHRSSMARGRSAS